MNKTINLDFSGAALLENSKENSIRRMKSGVATLIAVSVIMSAKSGKAAVKFVFNALAGGGAGHDEYLRTSSAEVLKQTLGKLRYAFINSTNEAHKALIAKLPDPFRVVMVGEGDAKTPLTFKTNEELENLRAQYGQNLDWIWAGNDSKDRVALFLDKPEEYAQAFAACAEQLVGTSYSLQVGQPTNGERFQTLKSIEKAPVSKKAS